jgi:hypothetical protein
MTQDTQRAQWLTYWYEIVELAEPQIPEGHPYWAMEPTDDDAVTLKWEALAWGLVHDQITMEAAVDDALRAVLDYFNAN